MSGVITVTREYIPEPPMPWIARRMMLTALAFNHIWFMSMRTARGELTVVASYLQHRKQSKRWQRVQRQRAPAISCPGYR